MLAYQGQGHCRPFTTTVCSNTVQNFQILLFYYSTCVHGRPLTLITAVQGRKSKLRCIYKQNVYIAKLASLGQCRLELMQPGTR